MSGTTITIIFFVLAFFVLAAAMLCMIYIANRRAEADQQEKERQRLAAAQARARRVQWLEARVLTFEQMLGGQLQEWSRQRLIHSFSYEKAHVYEFSVPLPLLEWHIGANVRRLATEGDSQAEWRKAVRAFADRISTDFSIRLKGTDINDNRFSLAFSEEEPRDA